MKPSEGEVAQAMGGEGRDSMLTEEGQGFAVLEHFESEDEDCASGLSCMASQGGGGEVHGRRSP